MIETPEVSPVTSVDTPSVAERIDLFTLRVVIYAPQEPAQRWIAAELANLSCVPFFTASLPAAFEALREEIRRRVLIIDIDALSKEELVELRTLRKQLPSGTFIALGQVREHVRAPLRITHVLARPLGSEALRVIVDELDRQRDTVKLL